MIEVKITADTLAELHAQLLRFVAELVPQMQEIAVKAKDQNPKLVEKSPKPAVSALHAPIALVPAAPAPAAPVPDSIDFGALREDVRAAAVEVSKTEHRTAGVVACLKAAADCKKVDEIAEDKLADVLVALRALL